MCVVVDAIIIRLRSLCLMACLEFFTLASEFIDPMSPVTTLRLLKKQKFRLFLMSPHSSERRDETEMTRIL